MALIITRLQDVARVPVLLPAGPVRDRGPQGSISSIKHVVIMVQENRSLDSYLGALRQYWAQNGYPDQSFDGLPQFNPASGAAPCCWVRAERFRAATPVCRRPATSCSFDNSNLVSSFHLKTMCIENPRARRGMSRMWIGTIAIRRECIRRWEQWIRCGLRRTTARGLGYYDTNGLRAMGYYDGSDPELPPFHGIQFWDLGPVVPPGDVAHFNINREYLLAATSGSYAYPNGTNAADGPQLQSKTIFQALQEAGNYLEDLCGYRRKPMHRALPGVVPDDAELSRELYLCADGGESVPAEYCAADTILC